MRAEAMKELREIQGKIAEYTERRVAAEDQLKRIDIRAPSDGYRPPAQRPHDRRRDLAGRAGDD